MRAASASPGGLSHVRIAEEPGDRTLAPRLQARVWVANRALSCAPATAAVRDWAEPASPQADPFTADYAHLLGCPDGIELRHRLATRLETVNDPRRERYLQLLAVVNGWTAPESLAPVFDWSVQALRVRTPGAR